MIISFQLCLIIKKASMKNTKIAILVIVVISICEVYFGLQFFLCDDLIYENFYVALMVVGLLLLLKMTTTLNNLKTYNHEEN